MALAWVLYALLVTLVIGLAAAAAERALRLYDRQARLVWALAMVASCATPLVLLLFPELVGGGSPSDTPPGWAVPAVPAIMGTVQGAAESGRPVLHWVQWGFFGVWGLGSLGLFLWLARSASEIRRRERGWAPLASDDGELFRSAELGPAAVGVRRPRVVLPDWVMELDRQEREMVMLHEREHARARDPAMVTLGWALVVIAPWNVALWWQFRRLRQAVELDCDLRVVRRVPDRRGYGRVLLEAYRLMSGRSVAPMATGGESFVGDRIRSLVDAKPRFRPLRAASAAGAILVAGLLVATLPSPRAAAAWAGHVELEQIWRGAGSLRNPDRLAERNSPQELAVVANRSEVVRAIRENYPEHLRRRDVGGEVHVVVHVGSDGAVDQALVQRSSGYPELDDAAREVARKIRYTAAGDRTDLGSFWLVTPIRFRAEAVR